MRIFASSIVLMAGLTALPALADTAQATCEIYPAGSDQMEKSVPCSFSMRQGYIDIIREDGPEYDLEPIGDLPGNFRDGDGRAVYRQSGLGKAGTIFRFPDHSIFLYWDAGDAQSADGDTPPAPFTTDDFDATAVLNCRMAEDDEAGCCPAGASRMEDGQASVTVRDPEGRKFTMNFMRDYDSGEFYVNATGRAAEARLNGDTWIVTVEGKQVYEVPVAFLEGG